MTKNEAFKLLTIMQANYPDSFKGMSDEGLKARVVLWAESFAEVPFETVIHAVKKFMMSDTSEFMPNIGKINKILHSESESGKMTAEEALRLVEKALRNSGYHAAEEFKKLPPLVQKAVGDYKHLKDWCMIEDMRTYEVEKSHFLTAFKAIQAREIEDAMVPAETKIELKSFAEGLENGARKYLPER